MGSRRLRIGLALVFWMAALAVGGATTPDLDETLPDPFSRRSTPLVSVAIVAFLVAIAVGALWLGRRSGGPRQEIEDRPDGPRVVMPDKQRERRRLPRFYDELRRRETVLENLEERGPDRPRLKVVELPTADRRSGEEEA